MKAKYLTFMAAGLLSVSTLAGAEDVGNGIDVSGNIAFTTDYRFRGISQTDKDFAIQGGFDVAHESGFYVGTWASNLDEPFFNGSQTEIDLYTGYGAALNEQWAWDFNVLYFYYPGASEANNLPKLDFVEFTPSVSYTSDAFSGSFGISYSPDYFAETDDGFYYNLGIGIPLGAALSLDLHAGYQTIKDNAAFGADDYADWSVGLSTSLFSLDWSVAYVDTELSDSECFGGTDLCDSTVVFTVAKSL